MSHQSKTLQKRILDCTLGEFAEAVAMFLKASPEPTPTNNRVMFKGMKGIMEIFGVSEYTAREIKKSGVIDDAIIQVGTRVFVIDREKALSLYYKQ